MQKYILPEQATSPRRNWSIIKILDAGSAGGMAIALGRWDDRPMIGLRWNGTADNPIGNPQSRGLSTWFMVEEGRYTDAIIDALPEPNLKTLVREFIPVSSK